MSGGTVPYHLRQHKAVERGVFMDLLQRISRATAVSLREYRYVGFAGPFGEDFKLIHSQLGLAKFTSIESDKHVIPRQKWNTPLRGIDYLKCTSGEYIDKFEPDDQTITWLDYTSPSELGNQLAEIDRLVSKLLPYDVLKVTFNANHTALEKSGAAKDAVAARIEEARNRLGDYLPVGFEIVADDVDRLGYPALILKGLELAIKSGMQGDPKTHFQPLAAFTYADSAHRMLTFTGILLPKGTIGRFFEETGLRRWRLGVTKWAERTRPIDIAMPEMSLRERLFIDQQLPRRGSSEQIMRRLGFRLEAGSEAKTIAALESYKEFYRFFPHFSRMAP